VSAAAGPGAPASGTVPGGKTPPPTPAMPPKPATQRPASPPPPPPSAGAAAGQIRLTGQPPASVPAPVAVRPPSAIVIPRNRTVQVVPSAAAVTLTGMSSTLEAARARTDGGQRTFNTYDVEIQKKFAIAVACAIFVLLGAPIALRFPRGGVGLVIGVSFGVFGLYYVGLIAGEPLAQAGKVTPFWAMWASNVIFLVVGGVLLSRVGRAGSTARGGDLGEVKDAIRAWFARVRHPLGTSVVPPEPTA
jgi:lipopolysaccharide export system permease protein